MSEPTSRVDFSRVGVAAGAGFVGIIIVLVIVQCMRSKRRRSRSTARAQTQQPTMRPIIIRDGGPRPPPSPQVPTHHPVHAPPYQPNTNQFQTHMSGTSGTSYAPGLGVPPQIFDLRTTPAFRPPTTPPTTYHPHPAVQYHVLHVRPHPPVQQQQQQPNHQFNSEDILSFEATGEDKKSPCPICLGPLEEEPISTGQCLHLMHTSCLKGWLAKDPRSACPVCRLPYSDDLTTDRPTPTAPPLDPGEVSPGPT